MKTYLWNTILQRCSTTKTTSNKKWKRLGLLK